MSRERWSRPEGEDPRSAARYAPYPEIISGKQWRVEDSRDRPDLPSIGVTDMTNNVVYTPLSEEGGVISRHEMAHVLFSPSELPKMKCDPLILHSVEDARINLSLAAAGMPMTFDFGQLADQRSYLANDLQHERWALLLLRVVAGMGTGGEDISREAVYTAPPRVEMWVNAWADKVRDRFESSRLKQEPPTIAPFDVGVKIARELAKEFDRLGMMDDPLHAPEMTCCMKVEKEDLDPDGPIPMPMRDPIPGVPRPGPDEVVPGTMVITEAPMSFRMQGGAARLVRPRASDSGIAFMRPDRYMLDRRVFRRPQRWRGGTVLIDVSGSMHLSEEDLDALVDASHGAALVATYCGNGRRGELRIVAKRGRRAGGKALAKRFGNGNIVDAPALEWLASKPEPRLWVCDGGVTGIDDKSSKYVRALCDRIVRLGGITRVAEADEAVRRLSGRRRASA